MELLSQVVITGILLGGLYALMALGLALVWGVLNIVNLSHGALIMLGAYVTYFLVTGAHIDPFAALPITALALFAIGYLIQRGILNLVIRGPMFNTLHLMFEGQYTELALAVDMIAERIRALGFPAPGTYAAYARLSSIKEEEGVPSAEEMIKLLVQGQEAVVRTARGIFPLLDKVSDEPTADLLTQRMQVHEKTAWMLRSLLPA